jgi:hypothetical protein
MKALTKKLCASIVLALTLLVGAAMPARAQSRVQTAVTSAGVTTVAYHPPVRFYFGVGPPYYYGYPYGYPYYYGRPYYYHRHWHRW